MKNAWKLFLVLAALCLAAGIWNAYVISYKNPAVTRYEVDCGLDEPMRIVQLSDLHDAEFGEGNAELIAEVRALEPDLICMTGDMLNADSAAFEIPVELVRALADTAPVCYSWGNHELDLPDSARAELLAALEEAGAIVLEECWIDLTLGGQAVRVGGLYDYAFSPVKEPEKSAWLAGETAAFLTAFQDTEAATVLLAHRPDSFIFGNAGALWDIDLVLSGHLHGGQVRLPLLGGLYAPDQGWFPAYAEGMHELGSVRMIISRGLGTTAESLPRWNNPPEIILVELQ